MCRSVVEARLGRRRTTGGPAVLTGTSGAYLGERPIPRFLQDRGLVVILGPRGVGNSAVARRVLRCRTVLLRGQALQDAAALAVQRKKWEDEVLEAPGLVIDGPTYLYRRPGATRLWHALIQARCDRGNRTVVCGVQGDESAMLLLEATEPEMRVTLNLRLPVGRGRHRFAARVCDELELARTHAKVEVSEPWTYLKVIRALKKVRRDLEEQAESADSG